MFPSLDAASMLASPVATIPNTEIHSAEPTLVEPELLVAMSGAFTSV